MKAKWVRVTAPAILKEVPVRVPGSKSISNRILILEALCKKRIRKYNLSKSNDTLELKAALNSKQKKINVGNGGTTYRFLLSYFASKKGKWFLDCGEQMKRRPIKGLADALIKSGVKIIYESKNGFPPVTIFGGTITKNKIHVNTTHSSQFLTSLLLIAPFQKNGLEISFSKNTVSKTYIDLTLDNLQAFKVKFNLSQDKIFVHEGFVPKKTFIVEADWSSAAFLYEILALSKSKRMLSKGLLIDSLQGDIRMKDLMEELGIYTEEKVDVMLMQKIAAPKIPENAIDLTATPDLFPALICTYAALGIKKTFTGLHHLKFKETNRLKLLTKQLRHMGLHLSLKNNSVSIYGKLKSGNYKLNPFNDHRLAMAYAPLALTFGHVEIENPDCVNKSFPEYWKMLKELGFKISFFER